MLDHVVGFSATHAYAHWLADVHSGSFAPAFTLSFHDSERSRKPPNAHSLGRYGQQQKMKKRPCSCYKIFDELTASVTLSNEFETTQIVLFSPFDLRTIPRRFLWKKDRIAVYHFSY